jgi:hypothetical protein
MSIFLGVVLLFSFVFQLAMAGTRTEDLLLKGWVATSTRNSGLDLSASYCTWRGFTCDDQGNLTAINHTCTSTFFGNYPPIIEWTNAVYSYDAPAFRRVKSMQFIGCAFGPFYPEEEQALFGKPPLYFVSDSTLPSTECPLTSAVSSSIGCSPTNIVNISYNSDLNLVMVRLNKRTGWMDAQCSYDYPNGTFLEMLPNSLVTVLPSGETDLGCPVPSIESFQVSIWIDGAPLTFAEPFGLGCPPGQGNNSGTGCQNCTAGTYNPSYGPLCISVPNGGYSSADGATSFTRCPQGTATATAGATSVSACTVVCGAGTYQTDNGCTSCPAGTFNAFSRVVSCTPCPAGTISVAGSISNTACTKCPFSTVPDPTQTECVPCPPSTTAPDGSATCIPCREGQTNDGRFLDCYDCPPGYYRQAHMLECQRCNPGTYQPNQGQAYCIRCRQNFYSNTSGATECTHCENGTVTYWTGQTQCQKPDEPYSQSSYVAGIVLTAIGGSFIVFSVLGTLFFFCYWFPKKRRELNGISNQMTELAKQST